MSSNLSHRIDLANSKQRFFPFISLRFKLMSGFAMVSGVVFLGLYGWFYTNTVQKAVQQLQGDMVNTLEGAIAGVDPAEFAQLARLQAPQNEAVPSRNPFYRSHQQWLSRIHQVEPRANPYTVIQGTRAYEVLWMGDILRELQPENATSFREPYLAAPEKTNLYKGFSGITLTLTPYTDQWGSWISAYGPIKDTRGRVIGLLGVDFRADEVARVKQEIGRTLAIAFGSTYLLLLLLVALLARAFTKPIIELTEAAEQISQGHYDQVLTQFHYRHLQDEISQLACSFEQMVVQVEQREADLAAANSNLEEQVRQRTRELQDNNTRLEKTLRELKTTQSQLIQTEKMSSLGQLVAGLAHEINNPLSFIQSNLIHAREYMHHLLEMLHLYQVHAPDVPGSHEKFEELGLDFIQDDLPKLLSSMQVGTGRIGEIVRSLRVFARLDESEIKAVNLHEGLDSTLMLLNSRLRGTPHQADIRVVRQYGELPLVECYAGQINQVFMNLLSNAIDALEDMRTVVVEKPYRSLSESSLESTDLSQNQSGEAEQPAATGQFEEAPTIRITTALLEGDRVSVCIADNGVGMSSDVQQRIFNPFFTTKPVGQGTGLGLSICHQIVTKRHRGTLKCTSYPVEGSEFCIEIPLRLNPSLAQESRTQL